MIRARSWLPMAIALSLCGAAAAIRTMAIPLFVTRELGASTADLGLLAAVTTGTAVAVELFVAHLSDQLRSRARLVGGVAVYLALGYGYVAFSVRTFWPLLAVGS